ncbi:hypothetical protein [Candidatus Tisiphia endosymbiont of Oplodontha viridula]|uniref:hypothetical protein n=1 Tax=Candidatus Tisiphia endosymbiont of Oplodontha viridula TaxID=3077925 RepID=UPI0035C91CFB
MAKLKSLLRSGKSSPEQLEAQNRLLEIQIDALFQEQCDITKITDALGIIDYQAIKERGESLSKQTADIQLSFKLNQYQAIIAFRAGKDSSQYLKACATPVDSRNEFMIKLEKKIAELGRETGEETVRNNINKNLYKPLLQVVQQKVENLIKAKQYDEAIAQTNGLINDTTVPAVIELYVDCVIKKFDSSNDPKLLAKTAKAGDNSKALVKALNDKEALVKALNLCKSKFEKTETKMLTIYQTFQSLQAAFDRAKDSPHAAEAAKLALRYNPEPSLEDKQRLELEQEIQQKKKELAESIKKQNMYEAKIKADKRAGEIDADSVLKKMQVVEKTNFDLVAKNAELMQQLAALTSANQASSSAELTSANQASNSTPSAPPPYSTAAVAGSLYPDISKERAEMLVTSPLSTSTKAQASSELKSEEPTTTINDSAQQALTEITTILNSDKPNMVRVKVLWQKAIEKQDNLYNFVDDPKLLVSLASNYLLLGNDTEATATCDKIYNQLPNAYEHIGDPKILDLLSKVYEAEGLVQEYVNSCKKLFQLTKTPCREKYTTLKQFGEETKDTDHKLAMDAFNAAKDQTTNDVEKAKLCMSIANIYQDLSKKTKDATEKQEYDVSTTKQYKEAVTLYKDVHKLTNDLEELQSLSKLSVRSEYKYLSKKYESNLYAGLNEFKKFGLKHLRDEPEVATTSLMKIFRFVSTDIDVFGGICDTLCKSNPEYYSRIPSCDPAGVEVCFAKLVGEVDANVL